MTEDAPRSQVVAVRFGDDEIQVRDLLVDVVAGIARRNGVTWPLVLNSPGSDLAVARDVLQAAAATLGVEPPELRTARQLDDASEHFVLVDDDLSAMPSIESGEPDPTTASETDG